MRVYEEKNVFILVHLYILLYGNIYAIYSTSKQTHKYQNTNPALQNSDI